MKPLSEIKAGDTFKLPSGAIVTAASDAELVAVEPVYRVAIAGKMPFDAIEGAADDLVEMADSEWPEEL